MNCMYIVLYQILPNIYNPPKIRSLCFHCTNEEPKVQVGQGLAQGDASFSPTVQCTFGCTRAAAHFFLPGIELDTTWSHMKLPVCIVMQLFGFFCFYSFVTRDYHIAHTDHHFIAWTLLWACTFIQLIASTANLFFELCV